MHIFFDGFSKVSFSNHNIRIHLYQNGPDNNQIDAGTLILPINNATGFINALSNSFQQLEEHLKAKNLQQQEIPKREEDIQ